MMQPAPKYHQQYFYQLQSQVLNSPRAPCMLLDAMASLADTRVELPPTAVLVMQVWGVDWKFSHSTDYTKPFQWKDCAYH